jgi:hypothetical protein
MSRALLLTTIRSVVGHFAVRRGSKAYTLILDYCVSSKLLENLDFSLEVRSKTNRRSNIAERRIQYYG